MFCVIQHVLFARTNNKSDLSNNNSLYDIILYFLFASCYSLGGGFQIIWGVSDYNKVGV